MLFKVKKIQLHLLYIIVAPLCPTFLKKRFLQKLIILQNEVYADGPAIQCVGIGWIPQA